MTTPTGPGDDRERQARTSSVVPSWQDPTPPGCTCTGGGSWHALTCPAKKREFGQVEPPMAVQPPVRPRPSQTAPSEADSAGGVLPTEFDVAAVMLAMDSPLYQSFEHLGAEEQATVLRLAELIADARALAASSGVRGGDDQARERLADVLALHQSLGAQNVWCGYDGEHWPCATVRAAGGQP